MNSTSRTQDASAETPIRIASWNIHGAIGTDGACRPDRIARIVQAMDADVVALQEIDGRTHLKRQPRAFETMADLLGGTIVEARLIGNPGREHGHIVWTRLPIRRSEVHLLPGGLEQRGCIEAELSTPHGPLVVLATHLGLSPFARRRQIGHVLRATAGQSSRPTILVGDLNEWMPRGPVHRALTQRLPNSLRPSTFPSRRPIARLDRLYASAGLELREIAAPAEASIASDHRPIVAEIMISDTYEKGWQEACHPSRSRGS